jgi:hypothetical protein
MTSKKGRAPVQLRSFFVRKNVKLFSRKIGIWTQTETDSFYKIQKKSREKTKKKEERSPEIEMNGDKKIQSKAWIRESLKPANAKNRPHNRVSAVSPVCAALIFDILYTNNNCSLISSIPLLYIFLRFS